MRLNAVDLEGQGNTCHHSAGTDMEEGNTWIIRLNSLLVRVRGGAGLILPGIVGTTSAAASSGPTAETTRGGAAQREAIEREPISTAKEQNDCTYMPQQDILIKDLELLCTIHKEIAAVDVTTPSLVQSTVQVLSAELLSYFAKVRSGYPRAIVHR